LTDAGLDRLERDLGRGGLYDDANQALLAAVHCALHARVLLQRDVDYIVRNGRVEIVDEFTGRVVDKRHWPDGLQAAVEAKENLERRGGGTVLGSITIQHFLGLYPKLAGMTATARSSADELREFYGRNVVVVPRTGPASGRRAGRGLSDPRG
jgi:preprotein translocase subunit SecA